MFMKNVWLDCQGVELKQFIYTLRRDHRAFSSECLWFHRTWQKLRQDNQLPIEMSFSNSLLESFHKTLIYIQDEENEDTISKQVYQIHPLRYDAAQKSLAMLTPPPSTVSKSTRVQNESNDQSLTMLLHRNNEYQKYGLSSLRSSSKSRMRAPQPKNESVSPMEAHTSSSEHVERLASSLQELSFDTLNTRTQNNRLRVRYLTPYNLCNPLLVEQTNIDNMTIANTPKENLLLKMIEKQNLNHVTRYTCLNTSNREKYLFNGIELQDRYYNVPDNYLGTRQAYERKMASQSLVKSLLPCLVLDSDDYLYRSSYQRRSTAAPSITFSCPPCSLSLFDDKERWSIDVHPFDRFFLGIIDALYQQFYVIDTKIDFLWLHHPLDNANYILQRVPDTQVTRKRFREEFSKFIKKTLNVSTKESNQWAWVVYEIDPLYNPAMQYSNDFLLPIKALTTPSWTESRTRRLVNQRNRHLEQNNDFNRENQAPSTLVPQRRISSHQTQAVISPRVITYPRTSLTPQSSSNDTQRAYRNVEQSLVFDDLQSNDQRNVLSSPIIDDDNVQESIITPYIDDNVVTPGNLLERFTNTAGTTRDGNIFFIYEDPPDAYGSEPLTPMDQQNRIPDTPTSIPKTPASTVLLPVSIEDANLEYYKHSWLLCMPHYVSIKHDYQKPYTLDNILMNIMKKYIMFMLDQIQSIKQKYNVADTRWLQVHEAKQKFLEDLSYWQSKWTTPNAILHHDILSVCQVRNQICKSNDTNTVYHFAYESIASYWHRLDYFSIFKESYINNYWIQLGRNRGVYNHLMDNAIDMVLLCRYDNKNQFSSCNYHQINQKIDQMRRLLTSNSMGVQKSKRFTDVENLNLTLNQLSLDRLSQKLDMQPTLSTKSKNVTSNYLDLFNEHNIYLFKMPILYHWIIDNQSIFDTLDNTPRCYQFNVLRESPTPMYVFDELPYRIRLTLHALNDTPAAINDIKDILVQRMFYMTFIKWKIQNVLLHDHHGELFDKWSLVEETCIAQHWSLSTWIHVLNRAFYRVPTYLEQNTAHASAQKIFDDILWPSNTSTTKKSLPSERIRNRFYGMRDTSYTHSICPLDNDYIVNEATRIWGTRIPYEINEKNDILRDFQRIKNRFTLQSLSNNNGIDTSSLITHINEKMTSVFSKYKIQKLDVKSMNWTEYVHAYCEFADLFNQSIFKKISSARKTSQCLALFIPFPREIIVRYIRDMFMSLFINLDAIPIENTRPWLYNFMTLQNAQIHWHDYDSQHDLNVQQILDRINMSEMNDIQNLANDNHMDNANQSLPLWLKQKLLDVFSTWTGNDQSSDTKYFDQFYRKNLVASTSWNMVRLMQAFLIGQTDAINRSSNNLISTDEILDRNHMYLHSTENTLLSIQIRRACIAAIDTIVAKLDHVLEKNPMGVMRVTVLPPTDTPIHRAPFITPDEQYRIVRNQNCYFSDIITLSHAHNTIFNNLWFYEQVYQYQDFCTQINHYVFQKRIQLTSCTSKDTIVRVIAYELHKMLRVLQDRRALQKRPPHYFFAPQSSLLYNTTSINTSIIKFDANHHNTKNSTLIQTFDECLAPDAINTLRCIYERAMRRAAKQ